MIKNYADWLLWSLFILQKVISVFLFLTVPPIDRMLFTRNAFFLFLLLLLTLPFLLPNILWLLRTEKTTGKVEGIGHASGISLGRDSYAYISFRVGKDTVYFQGKDDNYKDGDIVPLRYQKTNPEDARVASFYSIWGNTIAYCGVPLIFWIICFFAHDIIPKGSKIRLGNKPFIKVIPQNKRAG